MRVSLAWLAEWIDLPAASADLQERLTLAGLEIEEVARSGPDLSQVVVGHVVERMQHPDAERLSVCRVDFGDGLEPTQIVCGAANVAAGQRVAVARPGTVLPDGTKLKRSKIRGQVSDGMICSERELGLGGDHDGILVLPSTARLGAPLSEVVRAGDEILDLEITPNRGDWASMLGIAREVRAHFGGELRLPSFAVSEAAGPSCASQISVRIDDAEGCPHYVARVVRGVDPNAPTPDWMKAKLEAAGLRSLSVLVDITNLVLLELGQPLHAFDLQTLRGGSVRVRSALEGEKLVTLDGQTRTLEPYDLVIADAERAIALAGVMGGAETEVRESTRDVLIESARFAPARVRRTARRLALHSEASYRFERGVDPAGIERAADRAAWLMAELAGGQVASGRVEARGTEPERTWSIDLAVERCNRLLGTELSASEIRQLLEKVDVEVEASPGMLRCRVPSYRPDIGIPEDLIEEVARLHGYDRLLTTLPSAPIAAVARPPERVLEERVRDVLVTLGLIEVVHFPSAAPEELAALRFPESAPQRRPLRLQNPMTQRDGELRTTLLPTLLHSTARNLARQVDRVRIFEVGPVFVRRGEGELPREPLTLGVVVTRGTQRSLWERVDGAPLFFELRGIAERLSRELEPALELVPSEAVPYLHPGATLEVRLSGRSIGALGELHPETAAAFDIDVPCAVLELDLSPLVGRRPAQRAMQPISPYPAVRRDVAVLLDRGQPAGEVLAAVRGAGGAQLIAVELFDRFEGTGIPEGKVSLAFRMTFQRTDRTLTDGEVSKATDKVRNMLERRFGGELR